MSAFDINNCGCGCENHKIKDECLIAFKVYDFFRIQECLKCDSLGFARAAETTVIDGCTINEGDVIVPPKGAAAVTPDKLEIDKVNVLSKRKNPFKPGFYDVELQFVFSYRLCFDERPCDCMGCVKATNSFTAHLTLFGSIDTDINLSTDLFGGCGSGITLDANPFIWVESKAIPLAAELAFPECCPCDCAPDAAAVKVTIGLFAIIKLFRIVNLLVESKGFCIPEENSSVSSTDPCEFFENLDFPMDSFAPPQKPEFDAGISSNIPASPKPDKPADDSCSCCRPSGSGCGCGCNCGC